MPTDSILQRQSQATAWVQAEPRVRIADGRQDPAEREQSLPAVASRLDTWAACECVKTIRQPLSNARREGRSSLPRCVGCMLAIGWGQKRICRHTGWAKTSVHRWARFNSVNLSAVAEQKKAAEMAVRRRRAEEKKVKRLAEQARKKAERAARPKKSDEQCRAESLAYYYQHHERNKARANAYMKRRYASSEPGSPFRVGLVLRSRVYSAIKQGGGRKPGRTFDITGCTVQQLKAHIEAQFSSRMTWANYGRAWHIDHIMPCASFDLRDEQQVRQCFHFSNLRPLWARSNLRKSDTITDPQFKLLLPAA